MERVIFSAFGFGISLWSTLYYGKHLVEAWNSLDFGRTVQINYIVEHVKEEEESDSDLEWLDDETTAAIGAAEE